MARKNHFVVSYSKNKAIVEAFHLKVISSIINIFFLKSVYNMLNEGSVLKNVISKNGNYKLNELEFRIDFILQNFKKYVHTMNLRIINF